MAEGNTPREQDEGASRGNDELLIEALAWGIPKEQAGAVTGISERTVGRRLESKRFRDRVFQAKLRIAAEFSRDLHRARRAAFDITLSIAEDREAPATVRLGAARTLWGMQSEIGTLELERRIAELEASRAQLSEAPNETT